MLITMRFQLFSFPGVLSGRASFQKHIKAWVLFPYAMLHWWTTGHKS